MKQIYNMSTKEIRELVKQYMEHGVISRAIQCYERLLWLGELRQREYLRLARLYKQQQCENKCKRFLKTVLYIVGYFFADRPLFVSLSHCYHYLTLILYIN